LNEKREAAAAAVLREQSSVAYLFYVLQHRCLSCSFPFYLQVAPGLQGKRTFPGKKISVCPK